MSPAVTLEGVGKRYVQTSSQDQVMVNRLLRAPARILRGQKREHTWALRDVDLQVERGETVGVIGRNGSGKTTMLRLLSGVSAPSTGRLRVEGRIAPLIGVGVGFHPELTGRENVSVNGRLLGMSSAQVRERYDAIVDFSELESFVDTPVKYYSSGMFLRLAFAVAIHTEPEVLLVDEVLAVGDAAFQAKCMDRMRTVQAAGTTIVVVTHNLHSLDRLAARTVLLSHGRVVYDGPTTEAIGTYHQLQQDESRARADRAEVALRQGEGEQTYVGGVDLQVRLLDEDDRPTTTSESGSRVTVEVEARFEEEVDAPVLGLMVALTALGVPVYTTQTDVGAYQGKHGPDRPLVARFELDLRLLGGSYTVTCGVFDSTGAVQLGTTPPVALAVVAPPHAAGIADLGARVLVDGRPVVRAEHRRLDGSLVGRTGKTGRTGRTGSTK